MTARIDPQLFDPTRWEGPLADIARRHEVPGIVAGVLHVNPVSDAEQRFVAATGISNLRTGVDTDRTTLCQIGSITKLLTATMIMQLVDEGKLSLTTPVSEILPDLSFAELDPAELTVEHLLTHASGLDGDLFTDTGRGVSTSLGEGDEAPVQTMDLLPSESDTFVLGRPDARSAWMPLAFAEVDGREVAYVGIRCLPRAEAGPHSTDTDEKPADSKS